MRKINLSNGDTYGTNNSEGGLFRQHGETGAWNQLRGNDATPNFKSAKSFYNYIIKDLAPRFETGKPTMTSAFGWE